MRWNVWHRSRKDYLVRSREWTRSRVLLECPYGWRWYLGDRVSRQSLGIDHFRVPSPLPPLVQRTEEYTRAEIERYTVPTEVVFSPSIDYEGYLSTHLAYDLDMENRLRAGPALPELRREIEVVTADGALGVVTVPLITPTVTFATTEVTFDCCTCFDCLLCITDVSLCFRFLQSGRRRRTSWCKTCKPWSVSL